MRTILRCLVLLILFVVTTLWMESEAAAQWRPLQRLRERIASRASYINSYNGNYNDQYGNNVVVVRNLSGQSVPTASYSPYDVPQFASGFDRRLRVVDANGNYYNRYYRGNQQLGANWQGSPELAERARADYARNANRAVDYNAPRRSSSSSSSSSRFSQMQSQFNAIQAQSNAQINAINQRSQRFRESYMNTINGSSGGNSSSGISGSGTQTLTYDDNQPGK